MRQKDSSTSLIESVWFIGLTVFAIVGTAAGFKYLAAPATPPIYRVQIDYKQTTNNETKCWFLCRQGN